MRRRTKIDLLVVAILLGVPLWYFLREDYGINVDSVRWLPPKAQRITYVSNYLNRLAEFSIERDAFEQWCASEEMPLHELENGQHQMLRRCLWMLEQRGVLPAITEANEVEAELHRSRRMIKRLGPGDLFYEERWPNGGGYTIGYDSKEQRGYYEWNHH